MKINRSSTIRELNEQFTKQFPFLKITFHRSEHADHEGSPAGTEIDENKLLSELGVDHDEAFAVTEDLSVGAFEEAMEVKYGLHVQVSRRSGDLWLQTVSTDDWSLKDQNEKGKASIS